MDDDRDFLGAPGGLLVGVSADGRGRGVDLDVGNGLVRLG